MQTFNNSSHSRIPELNLLSFTFLPLVHEDNYALALLYIDYKEHIQLVSRNLRISPDSNADLDITDYSNLLPPTSISYKNLPNPAETAVHLIPIPADEDYMYDMDEDDQETDVFLGGILVVGGSKILLYELTSQEAQEFKPVKGKGKRKRDSKKQIDAPTDSGSKQKKEIKKRDPRATVQWPWSWVTAYVHHCHYCLNHAHPMYSTMQLHPRRRIIPQDPNRGCIREVGDAFTI